MLQKFFKYVFASFNGHVLEDDGRINQIETIFQKGQVVVRLEQNDILDIVSVAVVQCLLQHWIWNVQTDHSFGNFCKWQDATACPAAEIEYICGEEVFIEIASACMQGMLDVISSCFKKFGSSAKSVGITQAEVQAWWKCRICLEKPRWKAAWLFHIPTGSTGSVLILKFKKLEKRNDL